MKKKMEIKLNKEQEELAKKIADTFGISLDESIKMIVQDVVSRYFREPYVSAEDFEAEIFDN